MAYFARAALVMGKLQVLGVLPPPLNLKSPGMRLCYLMTLVLRKGSQIKVMAPSCSHRILMGMLAAYLMNTLTWRMATKMSLDSVTIWVSQHMNELHDYLEWGFTVVMLF